MTNENSDDRSMRVHINASSPFSSDEEALEALVKFQNLELDDLFNDRYTQLESDDRHGISISLYNEDRANYLLLRTDEESNLKISLTLEGDDSDKMNDVLNDILSVVDTISHNRTFVSKEFGLEFESLNLPLEQNPELEVNGIRLHWGNADFIIQKSDEGDYINVSMEKEISKKYEDSIPKDFLDTEIEQIDQFIEEEL
jgi:hypothetical protein